MPFFKAAKILQTWTIHLQLLGAYIFLVEAYKLGVHSVFVPYPNLLHVFSAATMASNPR